MCVCVSSKLGLFSLCKCRGGCSSLSPERRDEERVKGKIHGVCPEDDLERGLSV